MFFFNGKGWIDFVYIVFGLNCFIGFLVKTQESTEFNWVDVNLTQLIIE